MATQLRVGALSVTTADVNITVATSYTISANPSREVLSIFNKGTGIVTLTVNGPNATSTSFNLADTALYEPQFMYGNEIVISTAEVGGVDVSVIEG